MSKRFVIVSENVPAEIQNALTEAMRDSRVGFWHWINNVWLFTNNGETSAQNVYEWLLIKAPGLANQRVLVISVDGNGDYFGWLPPQSWSWLETQWHTFK